LKIKETDRIKALKTELRKLGFVLHDKGGRELYWDGEMLSSFLSPPSSLLSPLSASIDTYDDHRMALAFAPMSMVMPIRINNPQVVTKSYPRYWDDLRQAGFTIEGK
jgi:3-phosphoshikimate 1-carboxyvinyltransferase